MGFFEKGEINTHGDEEGAAGNGNSALMLEHLIYQRADGIAKDDEDDIADPDAGDEAKATFVAVVEALLDDGKNDRPHR